MGNFYTNITLRGTTQEAAIRVLKQLRRQAFITPDQNDLLTVYDAQCDSFDLQVLSDLCQELSRQLDCVAWGVLNHDDDLFMYELWSSGDPLDDYNSDPAYFAENADDDHNDEEGSEEEEEEESNDLGVADAEDETSEDDDFPTPGGPSGGNAEVLASAFGVPGQTLAIEALLSDPAAHDFAFLLHTNLAALLGIPDDWPVSGFNYLESGDIVPGLAPAHLRRIG